MLYIRSPTHSACMQARHAFELLPHLFVDHTAVIMIEPRPHLFVDHTAVIMIWRAQNADFTRAQLQFFDDSRQICVLRVPYGAAILKLVLGHVL